MAYRHKIAEAYNAGVDEEFNRLHETPEREAEYRLIIELLDEYISAGLVVIDIGSGPGRYAEHLLQRNCKAGVVDLSAKSLKAFSDRMENSYYKDNIIFNRVSCATQLDWINDNAADAILLMGPLYHLISKEHRDTALSHCRRILKPGGTVFSVFLSPYPLSGKDFKIIQPEIITQTRFQGYDIPQYRCWPEHAREFMQNNGFKTIRMRNLDYISPISSNKMPDRYTVPKNESDLIALLFKSCEESEILGHSHQYIHVGQCIK